MLLHRHFAPWRRTRMLRDFLSPGASGACLQLRQPLRRPRCGSAWNRIPAARTLDVVGFCSPSISAIPARYWARSALLPLDLSHGPLKRSCQLAGPLRAIATSSFDNPPPPPARRGSCRGRSSSRQGGCTWRSPVEDLVVVFFGRGTPAVSGRRGRPTRRCRCVESAPCRWALGIGFQRRAQAWPVRIPSQS